MRGGSCSYCTRSDTCVPASKNKRHASVQSPISWRPAEPPPPPASSWPFSNLCPPTAALPLGQAGCRRTSKHGLMGKDVIPVCCVLISGHRLEEHSFTRTTTRTRAMQQFSFFAPPSPVQPTWHRASGKTGSLCVLDVLGGKKRIWWDYSFATEGRPQTCCGSIRYAISP